MNVSTSVGLLVLVLGVLAARFLHRAFKEKRFSRAWLLAHAGVLVVGIALGVAAVAYSRYPAPDVRVLGFPFLAAEFHRAPGGGWVDFVGVRTYFATLGNFAVGLFLPHLVFAGVAWYFLKKRRVGGGT